MACSFANAFPFDPIDINIKSESHDPKFIGDELQKKYDVAVKNILANLSGLHKQIMLIQLSMIEEFADHITRSANVRDEWNNLLNITMRSISPEIKKMEKQKSLSNEVKVLLEELINFDLKDNVILVG